MVRVALPIGVSDYHQLAPLPSAVLNAAALEQILCCPERGGFVQPEPSALQNLTRQALETLVSDWSSRLKPDDLLLLYFSGYGLSDQQGQLYLATQDTYLKDHPLRPSSAVAVSTLQAILNQCAAKQQIVVFDCCRPNAMPDAIAPQTLSSLQHYLGGQGRLLFAAFPRSAGLSHSQDTNTNLLPFTRYLVDGLSSGVADQDGDGWVTMAELQDYTRRQVRRAAPTMDMVYTPHIEPSLRLVRSPAGSPELTYRNLVDYVIDDAGEISFVGRQELNRLRLQQGLSPTVATTLEAEARSPYEEYRNRLWHYEQTLLGEIAAQYPLEAEQRDRLHQMQQTLELREVDLTPITTRLMEQADQVYHQQLREAEQRQVQQRLQLYQQEFKQAARWEEPLRSDVRHRLDQLALKLELPPDAIASVEQEIMAQVGFHSPVYQQKMQQYDRDYRKMIQRQYPLAAETFDTLQQFWQHLELRSQDVESIEQQAIATLMQQQTNDPDKLSYYKAIAEQALALQFPLNPVAQRELLRLQQALELQTVEVTPIQQEIIQPLKRQQAIAQEKLERYRQEFARAMKLAFPMPEATYDELKQFQQDLGIHSRDVSLIERQIIAQVEAVSLDAALRLKRYVQEFAEAVRQLFPLSKAVRQGLNELKQNLGLKEAELSTVEQEILRQAHEQEQQYQRHLERYAHQFAEQARLQLLLNESTRQDLWQVQCRLNLNDQDVQQIEALILARYPVAAPPHADDSPSVAIAPPSNTSLPPFADAPEDFSNGHSSNGHSSNGHSSNGHSSNGHSSNGHSPNAAPSTAVDDQFATDAMGARSPELESPELESPELESPELESPELESPELESRELEDLGAESREPEDLGAESDEENPFGTAYFEDCEPEGDSVEAPIEAPIETPVEAPVEAEASETDGAEMRIVRSPHAHPEDAQFNQAADLDGVLPTTRLPQRFTEPEPLPTFPTTDPFTDLPDRYVRLVYLLEQQNWKEADLETFGIMLEISDRRQARWLDRGAIDSLFCADLRLMDQLWRHYSGDRFGFSVQRQIYENLHTGTAIEFGKQVGWWMKGLEFFKYYNSLNFSRKASPGHFPAYWFWQMSRWDSIRAGGTGTGRGGCGNDSWMLSALMAKLAECHIL